MKQLQIAVFLLAGCAAAPASPGSPSPGGGVPLPEPAGALEFSPGAGEIGLDPLLRQFAQLTRQELVVDRETAVLLQETKEPLESAAPVPAAEVYAFVEGLLARHGFFVVPVKDGSRPLLGVYSTRLLDSRVVTPLVVDLARLDELDGHPALLVRVVVQFENIDTRQLQTQLRQLVGDPSGMRLCVPAGERGLLLQGLGRDTAGLVRLLKETDAAAARPHPLASGAR